VTLSLKGVRKNRGSPGLSSALAKNINEIGGRK